MRIWYGHLLSPWCNCIWHASFGVVIGVTVCGVVYLVLLYMKTVYGVCLFDLMLYINFKQLR